MGVCDNEATLGSSECVGVYRLVEVNSTSVANLKKI